MGIGNLPGPNNLIASSTINNKDKEKPAISLKKHLSLLSKGKKIKEIKEKYLGNSIDKSSNAGSQSQSQKPPSIGSRKKSKSKISKKSSKNQRDKNRAEKEASAAAAAAANQRKSSSPKNYPILTVPIQRPKFVGSRKAPSVLSNSTAVSMMTGCTGNLLQEANNYLKDSQFLQQSTMRFQDSFSPIGSNQSRSTVLSPTSMTLEPLKMLESQSNSMNNTISMTDTRRSSLDNLASGSNLPESASVENNLNSTNTKTLASTTI